MSTKSKLLAVTENLQLPAERVLSQGGGTPIPSASQNNQATATDGHSQTKPPLIGNGPPPRTGPGQMLQFRGQMLAIEGELGTLRERLKEHQGSTPTRKLDPKLVFPSRWANRHPDSFSTAEFASLKQDIEQAGGNIQPISVRALDGRPGHYEIVFGHRRHRACSELGIPVLATIEAGAVTDFELFSAMDRENRERADLSPYEQGTMYRRALDEKLFASNRRLAEALGVSHTWVANVLQVADLPAPVVECFRSPLEIQYRHAKVIATALDLDRKGVLRRAEKFRAASRQCTAAEVTASLVGSSNEPPETGSHPLKVDGRLVGSWTTDRGGRLTVHIEAKYLGEDRQMAILKAIQDALQG